MEVICRVACWNWDLEATTGATAAAGAAAESLDEGAAAAACCCGCDARPLWFTARRKLLSLMFFI